MKNAALFFAGLLLFLCMPARAQVFQGNEALDRIARVTHESGWIRFNEDVAPEASSLFSNHGVAFGLSAGDEMMEVRRERESGGVEHIRYQQTYRGVPVAGADFVVHSRDGRAVLANGKLVRGLQCATEPAIMSKSAIDRAVAFVGAQRYMWENPANEARIRNIRGDASASYAPAAELMIFDKRFSAKAENYRLVWKVNVYAETPLTYQDVFVDAQNGEIVHMMNRLHSDDVQGTAMTKFSGLQTITTDSLSGGGYRLVETGRGSGIETYNMLQGTSYGDAVDFTDVDNYWDNVNADEDEVATDAHWGAEMTYDYYLLRHGRNSYDNAGAKLVSYVHYDQDYDNAFWDGSCMTYGDGGSSYAPFTSLDVCGHEITHGVTEYSANLIYQYESGALNEAFSDIFGTCIENYALNGAGDWLIGEDFDLSGDGFRNMANPNADDQPDTYHGTNWYTGDLDYGGVHYNNGVGNFWFYLLTEGGTGVNDLGHNYHVDGLGMDTAALIAYRALTVYLTSTSQFIDARMATLQSAIDLFGLCSNEYVQCANAWFAVGVGLAVADNDFSMNAVVSPLTACGLGQETVAVELLYNGCTQDVPAGDSLFFYYSLDNGPNIYDTLVLSASVLAGDTVSFSFSLPADVSLLGQHSLDVGYSFAKDTLDYNNEILAYTFENKLYQNIDVGITSVTAPVSACGLTMETVEAGLQFFGCEFLPAGKVIGIAYRVNGGALVHDSVVLSADLYPGVTLPIAFSVPADLSIPGAYTLDVMTTFAEDTLNSNDEFPAYAIKNPALLGDTVVSFEEANAQDMFLVRTTHYSNAYISTNAENTGSKGFLMTGGNPMAYMDMIEFPNGNNTWQINDFLSAKIDFCVDATAWSQAHVAFDLKQTFGQTAYSMFLGAGDYSIASNFRVLVNDSHQIGGTYNPTAAGSDPYLPRFADLSAFAGTKFTLSFETRNLSRDTLMFVMDNAYLDNVRISEASQVGVSEVSAIQGIAVHPNPVRGPFWLSIISETAGPVQIALMDMTGKVVYRSERELQTGDNKLRIDPGSLAAGVYQLSANHPDGVETLRILIQ